MPQLIRVTDDTTLAEIDEALTNLARHAMRQPHVVGSAKLLTPWDATHARIDVLLDERAARG